MNIALLVKQQLGMPLYVMLCLDGNGESEVVALAFVQHENKETLTWIAETFKEKNPNYINLKCIMCDKDMVERDVFETFFPGVHNLICSFHVQQILKREITTKKMEISEIEKNFALEILQDMMYAKDKDAYVLNVNILKENCPDKVIKYFT
ncbi:unnamed protein product [Meganyctiphanes norvegica]|uniref:ZSWIM1/3 RNaseH-like domain-containing protein n=1 Tax=Meganyctiphanes norvegica TaxID=48144 RepID=A0AAV2PPV3_MEGNR